MIYNSLVSDIHPKFIPNHFDAYVASELARKFKLPGPHNAQARLTFFEKNSELLSNYSYWFLLSTIWVEYSGFTNLGQWRRLFSSDRPDRDCLMKPSEILQFEKLDEVIKCYRAHRKDEKDWISYTTNPETAEKFLKYRPGGYIKTYFIRKEEILCLFLRRNENELICLNKGVFSS